MKPKYKIIIVAWINLLFLILPIQIVKTCSHPDFDASDYQIELFDEDLISQHQSLRLTPGFLYQFSADEKVDYIRNCQEWQTELGKGINLNDIYFGIYQMEADDFLTVFSEPELTDTISNNTFLKALSIPKNKTYLEYLKLAFRIQFWHNADRDPWDLWNYEFKDKRYEEEKEFKKLNEQLELNFISAQSDFFKERYAYQLVVNYRYTNQYQKCLNIFDKYLKTSKSIIRPWACIHIGHAYFKTKQSAKGNLFFAKAFLECESKKRRAHQGFLKSELKATIAIAPTPELKATIYIIANLQHQGKSLDAIQYISKLYPKSEFLPVLIHREISKLENWLLAPYLTAHKSNLDIDWEEKTRKPKNPDDDYFDWYYDDNAVNYDIRNTYYTHKNYRKDIQYLRKVRTVLLNFKNREIARPHRNFLNLAISHLYFLDFKPQEGWDILQQVKPDNDKAIQKQYHIERVLILSQLKDVTKVTTQAALYQSLDWLEQQSDTYKSLSQLNLYLAQAFYKKGKTPEAGLLYAQTSQKVKGLGGNIGLYHGTAYYASIVFFDKYATIQDIDKTITLIDKKNKTPFEKYMTSVAHVFNKEYWKVNKPALEEEKESDDDDFEQEVPSTAPRLPPPPEPWDTMPQKYIDMLDTFTQDYKYRLYDVQGVIAFRQDKLKKANAIFSKMPSNFWKEVYEFSDYLEDPFLGQYTSDTIPYYHANRKKIVERMIDLKNDNSPDSLLLLADAYSAMTRAGNAWMMFSYGKYPNDFDKENLSYDYSFYPNSVKYEKVYYRYGRAELYFKKVFNHPKATLEDRASALFKLAQIDEYNYELPNEYQYEDYISPLFYELKRDFKEAKNYNSLLGCSHFVLWEDL